MRTSLFSRKKRQRGVSLLMVALALVALIAMAALSIDVASLYTARGEAQRAANAAALAGAKMFVSSGYTTAPAAWGDPTKVCSTTGPGSVAAANKQAEAAAAANLIAGQPAQVQSITCDLTRSGNPNIKVTVQRLNLPIFFARIWGNAATTVTATATAEAYNPSNNGLSTPQPFSVTAVKPWLVPNCNPNISSPGPCPSGYFINPADGSILNNGEIGSTIALNRILSKPDMAGGTGGGGMNFYGLVYPDPPAPVCPSASSVSCGPPVGGGTSYIDNIACASTQPFRCGEPIVPSDQAGIQAESTTVSGTPTRVGARCLIHADDDGFGQGQDAFSTSGDPGDPATITGGYNNPNPSLRGAPNISRSDSVITVPLYDGTQLCTSVGQCHTSATVIGFLQLGIKRTIPAGPEIEAVVLNAVGCSPALVSGFPPSNPISIGGTSPIPVRLIQLP